jgi:hypothetical protein
MLQVVEPPEEEDDIEMPDFSRRQVIKVLHAIVHPRVELGVRVSKSWVVPTVHCEDVCPTPLHLETEPTVPCTDVQYALPADIVWDVKSGKLPVQSLCAADAVNALSTGELKTVPPALL